MADQYSVLGHQKYLQQYVCPITYPGKMAPKSEQFRMEFGKKFSIYANRSITMKASRISVKICHMHKHAYDFVQIN